MSLELGYNLGVKLTWLDMWSEKNKGIKYNSEVWGLSNWVNGGYIYELWKAEKKHI